MGALWSVVGPPTAQKERTLFDKPSPRAPRAPRDPILPIKRPLSFFHLLHGPFLFIANFLPYITPLDPISYWPVIATCQKRDFTVECTRVIKFVLFFNIMTLEDSNGRTNSCRETRCLMFVRRGPSCSKTFFLSIKNGEDLLGSSPKDHKRWRHGTATPTRRISTCPDRGEVRGPLLMSRSPNTAGGEKWYTWTFITWCSHIGNLGPTVVWEPRHACRNYNNCQHKWERKSWERASFLGFSRVHSVPSFWVFQISLLPFFFIF